jgi:hypothetical protein
VSKSRAHKRWNAEKRIEHLLRDAGHTFNARDTVPPPNRSCHGKRQYSARIAKAIARDIVEERGEAVEAYPCRWCHGWHIGHPPRPGAIQRPARDLP